MRVLVTGASGFVGSLLVPRLRAQGHAVVALGRDPERVRAALADSHAAGGERGVRIVRGDLVAGRGLTAAFDQVEVAYYLVHSMERSQGDPALFDERDLVAARNFAAAASASGLPRIVYLGGLLPRARRAAGTLDTDIDARVSRHLASRAEVERVLLEAVADSLALRASIVIGARSRSFRLLVRLVERMPVLTLPAWRSYRTQPIDARDVTAMLAACATSPLSGRHLDIGGPEALSYGEMLTGIAELMLIRRPAIGMRVNMTSLTARMAAAIAREDPALVVPLMEGLQGDLLPERHHAAELLGVKLHSFRAAVERALGDWEACEPLAAR